MAEESNLKCPPNWNLTVKKRSSGGVPKGKAFFLENSVPKKKLSLKRKGGLEELKNSKSLGDERGAEV